MTIYHCPVDEYVQGVRSSISSRITMWTRKQNCTNAEHNLHNYFDNVYYFLLVFRKTAEKDCVFWETVGIPSSNNDNNNSSDTMMIQIMTSTDSKRETGQKNKNKKKGVISSFVVGKTITTTTTLSKSRLVNYYSSSTRTPRRTNTHWCTYARAGLHWWTYSLWLGTLLLLLLLCVSYVIHYYTLDVGIHAPFDSMCVCVCVCRFNTIIIRVTCTVNSYCCRIVKRVIFIIGVRSAGRIKVGRRYAMALRKSPARCNPTSKFGGNSRTRVVRKPTTAYNGIIVVVYTNPPDGGISFYTYASVSAIDPRPSAATPPPPPTVPGTPVLAF